MAGACTGNGVRVNPLTNGIEASVDRVERWPYPGSATTGSSTRVDPDTGLLWTPPDQIIKVVEAPLGPNRVIVPNSDDTIRLVDLALEMVASKAHDQVLFDFSLSGGYQGYRMGLGNFWAVYRRITTYTNDAPVTYSGFEEAGGCENNAGGSLGSSNVADAFHGQAVRDGGQKFKVVARYELRPLAFTDRPTNSFAWRPPRFQIRQFSMPQVEA